MIGFIVVSILLVAAIAFNVLYQSWLRKKRQGAERVQGVSRNGQIVMLAVAVLLVAGGISLLLNR